MQTAESEARSIFAKIDHTLLKPTADRAALEKLCEEALRYGAASVCVPPNAVAQLRAAYPALCVCTVIGFPLGYHTAAVKRFEAEQAAADGADELDMVIDLCALKNGEPEKVEAEIAVLRRALPKKVLKVIVETCYLTQAEKRLVCTLVEAAGADFIKTSTGFGSAGAQLEDIALFRQLLQGRVKIKAAGGIRTREQMLALLAAGADRLGASAGVTALFGE